MKALALVLLLLASVTSATIDGEIKEVAWGLSGESEPIIVKPLILIENTGDQPARYHVLLTVDRRDGKRYSGGCWPTDEIDAGKTGMTWPYPLRLPNRGDLAYVAVELYSQSCLKSNLLDVQKRSDSVD
jgi:hypothetical protein